MAGIVSSDDTIAALSTPLGEGAVGIVRLSGPDAIAIADRVFLSKKKRLLSDASTYSLSYGWIVNNKADVAAGDTASLDGRECIVDEVVVSLMRGPKSYTRQDVVEISGHGGPRALSGVLGLVLENGARLAQPGEFTKRAFLNGRLDLAQAEAVLDIIQAKSDLALKRSQAQLAGEVSDIVRRLRAETLELLARMEARIDFPEEDVGVLSREQIGEGLLALSGQIAKLLERSFQGRVIREGLKVVFAGRTNVGKSSLLNALLRQERAIVAAMAGTTRDTIEEYVNMKGLGVCLIDTAGILEPRDEVEREAVNRAQTALVSCDLVVFVVDGSVGLSAQDRRLAQKVSSKSCIVVVNKSDQPQRIEKQALERLFLKKPLEVSALTGANIEALEEAIVGTVFDGKAQADNGVLIGNVRHIEVLRRAAKFLEMASATASDGFSLEFIVLDLKKALETLGELTGEVFTEGILETIFSKFCIGK